MSLPSFASYHLICHRERHLMSSGITPSRRNSSRPNSHTPIVVNLSSSFLFLRAFSEDFFCTRLCKSAVANLGITTIATFFLRTCILLSFTHFNIIRYQNSIYNIQGQINPIGILSLKIISCCIKCKN